MALEQALNAAEVPGVDDPALVVIFLRNRKSKQEKKRGGEGGIMPLVFFGVYRPARAKKTKNF